jgi:hypothetical protein
MAGKMFLFEAEDRGAARVGVPLITRRLRKCLVRKSQGAYEVDSEVHGTSTTGGDNVCKTPGTYPEKTVEYVVEELGLGSAAWSGNPTLLPLVEIFHYRNVVPPYLFLTNVRYQL